MKTRVPAVAALAQLLCVVLAWSSSFQAAAADAVITDAKGTKTSVTGIRAHLHDNCKQPVYYLGVATETDHDWNSIFLSVDGDRYQVELPLDIIKTVTHAQSDREDKLSTRSQQWKVVLSDDTALVGEPAVFEDFEGEAELGAFSLPWRSVSEIVFSSPKTTYQAKANGSRAVALYVTDTEKRNLTGAAFIYEDRNQNFCFLGFSYKGSVQFVTDGGARYDLTWDKIRELGFSGLHDESSTHPSASRPLDSIDLVSPSGTEYRGGFKYPAVGVEAVGRIGAFQLHMIIRFTSTATKLTVDQR
jgi:hypothetical protein